MPTASPVSPPLVKIPFSRVVCDGNELAYVKEVLESGSLTTSSKAIAFEKAFAQHLGVGHAIAVNSCTAALHLGLEAMGVGPGDEVLVPTMTFTATAVVVSATSGPSRASSTSSTAAAWSRPRSSPGRPRRTRRPRC